MSTTQIPEKVVNTCRVIWFAFLTSPIILLTVGWVLINQREEPPGSTFSLSDPLILGFCLVAVALFVAAQRLPRLMVGSSQPQDQPEEVSAEKVFPAFVVRLALFEAIGILGFVLLILKGSFAVLLPFLLLSAAGLLNSSPTPAFLIRLAGIRNL